MATYFINRRVNREALVKTHIDKIGGAVWNGFGIGIFIFYVSIYTFAFRIEDFHVMLLINSIIMIMVGICEFATACIYRSKSWYWVAVLFWAGAVTCAFLTVDIQLIVLAVCMVLGFVIPGHILNRQAKKSHV
jgi:hypothetical protein